MGKTSAARTPPTPLEREVLHAIMAYLKARGILAWRNNSGKVVVPASSGRARRCLRAGLPGSSDILGCFHGRLLAIEVKRPGQRPTRMQVAFLRLVNEAGGCAFWCDAVDTVKGVLDRVEQGLRVEVAPNGLMWLTDEPLGSAADGR